MIRINESKETIRQFLIRNELKRAQDRLDQLTKMDAPGIMVKQTKQLVDELKRGKMDVGGDQSLLDSTFSSFKEKKGNGGKSYIEFDNGIKYFPNAKYGRYITK